jgi:outer membrane receptor protein involved in Fe transport
MPSSPNRLKPLRRATTANTLFAVTALTWFTPSMAQTLQLEEVLVTAQKRSESLQDVPIAVTAISGEKIVEAGINGLEDLTTYVPNVQMSRTAAGGSPGRLYIRGIGSGNLASFEQSVGTFVDGIYSGRFRQFLIPFLDVSSVEVLKGPQGTLFGKNTVAGALIVNSARPTDTFEGDVRARYEMEYGSTEYVGIVSGPLTSTLSGRVAAQYQDFEGYMDNLVRDTDEPEAENTAVRGSVLWEPADALQVYAKLDYSKQKTFGSNAQLTNIDGDFRGIIEHRDVLSPLEDGKFDDKNTLDSWQQDHSKTDSVNAAVQVDWELDNATTFTALTGYSEYDAHVVSDGDFSNLFFLEPFSPEKFSQYSQEFRLSAPISDTVDYLAGLYLEYQELDVENFASLSLTSLSAVNVPGSPIPAVDLGYGGPFHQETKTAAAFGQVSWRFIDNWSLIGGLRYSYEDKSAKATQFATDFGSTSPTNDPVIVNLVTNLLNREPGTIEDDRDPTFVDWSANLVWDYSENGMTYLRAAHGNKSGGFNQQIADPTDLAEFEYDDEEVDTVELGVKTTLLEGAANLNMAAFYTEITGSQESSFIDNSFIVQNSDIESKGFEVEGRWIAAPFLNFAASMGYLDSKYSDFPDAPCTVVQLNSPDPVAAGCAGWTPTDPAAGRTNLKGDVAGRSPKWTGVFSTYVVFPLGESMVFNGSVDLLYEDELNEQTSPNYQGDYTMVNASLGIVSAANTWSVTLIGRNLTDELTYGNGAGAPFFTGSWFKNRTAPRTVALQLGYRF